MKNNMDVELIRHVCEKYPLHPDLLNQSTKLSYGTAGFRDRSHLLDGVLFRVGLLAGIRSRFLHGSTIGLMITASHNPHEDNGVKIIDPSGEMMDSSWESLATELANASSTDEIFAFINGIIAKYDISDNVCGSVLVARDTRFSGVRLSEAAIDGISLVNSKSNDLQMMTTPQLHYLVRCSNDKSYGTSSLDGYYDKVCSAFLASVKSTSECLRKVVVDCANGIGALQLRPITQRLSTVLDISIENHDTFNESLLNTRCGADYVKLHRIPPEGFSLVPTQTYVSFDGDADRIVYFYIDHEKSFHLLDGDKLAILFCTFIQKSLNESKLQNELSFRLIQTAYANGSSTRYANEVLHVETDCVPTGVKHLHHRSKQFDISVYFEANGHGTVLFSDKAIEVIRSLNNTSAIRLAHFIDVIDQTTGDAISDMLATEFILHHLNWSIQEWDSTYTDLPSRQLKVEADRTKVQTTDAERICTAPIGLQESINAYVTKLGPNARCFVRPSGTEDIVRVYAEAETQEKADTLANAVAEAVVQLVNVDYDDK